MSRLLIAALALAAASTAASQQPGPPIFSARAEVVVLHVIVMDRGAHVADLPVEAFTVFEDGKPQPIQFFSPQDAPATVGLLIDSSGSMAATRVQIAAAAEAFVETSNPRDDVFALGFNEYVRAALPLAEPFTSEPAVLRAAVQQTLAARGRTALHDAMIRGLSYVASGRHERRALVVLSDGGDNASRATFDDVVDEVLRSNAAIYTVALIDPVRHDVNPGRLRRMAKATGGLAFEPRGIDEVGEIFQEIAQDIRHAYTIAYAPTETGQNGRVRRIEVRARSHGRAFSVRTRQGYVRDGE